MTQNLIDGSTLVWFTSTSDESWYKFLTNLTMFYQLWKSWLYEMNLLKYSPSKMPFAWSWPHGILCAGHALTWPGIYSSLVHLHSAGSLVHGLCRSISHIPLRVLYHDHEIMINLKMVIYIRQVLNHKKTSLNMNNVHKFIFQNIFNKDDCSARGYFIWGFATYDNRNNIHDQKNST